MSRSSSRASSVVGKKIETMVFDGKVINVPDRIKRVNGLETDCTYYCNQGCQTKTGGKQKNLKAKTYREHMELSHPHLIGLVDITNWAGSVYIHTNEKINSYGDEIEDAELENVFTRLLAIQQEYSIAGLPIVGAQIFEKHQPNIKELEDLYKQYEAKKKEVVKLLEKEETNFQKEKLNDFSNSRSITTVVEGEDEKSTASDQLRKKDEEIKQLTMQVKQMQLEQQQSTLKTTTSGKGKVKNTGKNDIGKEPSNDEEKDL
jgi:hypothetical protein